MTDHSPGSSGQTRVLHGFSIDVEDWFHILDCAGAPDPGSWRQLESRVEAATQQLLDLLDQHHVKATFFALGWVAEQRPQLIAEIARRGHELGSHSHEHGLVGQLGRDGFARDLDRSIAALQRAGAGPIRCFRAPGFSMTAGEVRWALPILAERGIDVDSSLFLSARAHGGLPLDRARPFDIELGNGKRIREVPLAPRRLGPRELPFSGGGYLRLLPWWLLRDSFARAEARGEPVIAYLHPREIDPQQPRMQLPPLRRFKYYVGLDTVRLKLEKLFGAFRFGTLRQVADQTPLDRPASLDELAAAR